VERAERSRAPIQKTADRLAGYLVYFALASAVLTFFITHNVRSTISVIIVAGACGIAAGTPLAILGAIGQAARKGAIIKGGLHLETLSRADTVLLDKTGTLSYGVAEVLEIHPAPGVSAETLLTAAAIAESRSEHPVAKAILSKVAELKYARFEPEQFDYAPGKGVIAIYEGREIVAGNRLFLKERGIDPPEWKTTSAGSEVGIARDGQFLGNLYIGDVLRQEAREAISALRSMGLKTILLTGDIKSVAEAAAKILGVDEVGAELLPAQKLERVRQLMSEGHTVVMVGDGINDAPALMQASVGVAMGSGTEVARESASVVLIGNDLAKFVGNGANRPPVPQDYSAELHRHPGGGWHRHHHGRIWFAEPAAGRLHPCHLGACFHPELNAVDPRRSREPALARPGGNVFLVGTWGRHPPAAGERIC
jgi:P-type Cu+ transporter